MEYDLTLFEKGLEELGIALSLELSLIHISEPTRP